VRLAKVGGLEFAGEEEQPLEVRGVLGHAWNGASRRERLQLPSTPNLQTLAGLERAREAQQPLEFRVVLGLVLVRCQLEGQQRLLPISERTFRIRGGYNRNVTIAIGSTP
jgi:hypothetical protein